MPDKMSNIDALVLSRAIFFSKLIHIYKYSYIVIVVPMLVSKLIKPLVISTMYMCATLPHKLYLKQEMSLEKSF